MALHDNGQMDPMSIPECLLGSGVTRVISTCSSHNVVGVITWLESRVVTRESVLSDSNNPAMVASHRTT